MSLLFTRRLSKTFSLSPSRFIDLHFYSLGPFLRLQLHLEFLTTTLGPLRLFFLAHVLAATLDDTGAAGGDQTDLLTRRGVARLRGRVTHVLVVTTTVRVLDRVHRHTTNLRPGVALHAVLVEGRAGLQHGLVNATATGDDTNNAAGAGGHFLACAGRELQHGLLAVFGVAHHDAARTRGASQGTTVTELVLDHAHDSTCL